MKTVKDRRLALVIELTKEAGQPLGIICRADYEVTCSACGETIGKTKADVELTPAEKTTIKNFGLAVLQKIKNAEE